MYLAEERVWLNNKLAVFSTKEVVCTFFVPSRWKACRAWTIYSKW